MSKSLAATIKYMDTKNWLTLQENYNMLRLLEKAKKNEAEREVIFLCVGNAKVWYDSFGPILGSVLGELELNKFIYGNTRADIRAANLDEYIEMIYKFHINPYIIVVDSCFSKARQGLFIKEGSITCASFSKSPRSIGDLSITFNISREFIKDPSNNAELLKDIRRAARFIMFVFKNQPSSRSLNSGLGVE